MARVSVPGPVDPAGKAGAMSDLSGQQPPKRHAGKPLPDAFARLVFGTVPGACAEAG